MFSLSQSSFGDIFGSPDFLRKMLVNNYKDFLVFLAILYFKLVTWPSYRKAKYVLENI